MSWTFDEKNKFKMKKLKILYFLQGLEFGGLEKMVCDLAKEVKKRGLDVKVCLFDKKGVFANELETNGISITLIKRNQGIDFYYPFKLASFIKSQNIDVVHAHNSTAWFYSVFAAMLTKRPLVYTEHDRSFPSPFKIRMLHFLFSKRSKVVAVSNAIKEELRRFEWIKDVQVVFNGIDENHFSPISKEEKIKHRKDMGFFKEDVLLINVGRMDRLKNQSVLLKTLKRLPFQTKLLLVGDGENYQKLKDEAKVLRLENRVFFLGKRKDVNKLLRIADIFVFPSLSEGLPLAVIEAMASGLPIVASDVGGIPELVKEKVNGFLIKPMSLGSIERAIYNLIHNSSLREKMGENSEKIFKESFTLSAMCKAYIEIYQKVFR